MANNSSEARTFKQILSAIARVQTDLSQQNFAMMDLAEKQAVIQDKLSLLEQRYGLVDEGVSRVIEYSECLRDDVRDVRDRVADSTTNRFVIRYGVPPHRVRKTSMKHYRT